MSTRFDEEECIVCELRPPGDHYFWLEWLADRLGWVLVDGQNIQPPPLTPDEQAEVAAATTGKKLAGVRVKIRDTTPYAKLVYRGEKNSILKVWSSRPTGIQVIFQGVLLSVKPVGIGQFKPTQFGPNGGAATVHDTPDSVEFDMNEDNNAVQSRRDMGRKLSVEESSILDVIDELGLLLPLAQRCFEMHAKVVDQDSGTGAKDRTKHGTKAAEKITPYACCKAIGSLLELNITIEELLLDSDNNVRAVDMHSALTRIDVHTDPASAKLGAGQLVKNIAHLALQGKGQSSKFPSATLTYIDFLYILLRLKRLKEEDPNIVSPRESARGSARAGTGMGKSLGGDGDTFGKGAGISEREVISSPRSPRNTIYSPRTSMMLANAGPSGGVMSPRPFQSLTHSAGAAAATPASESAQSPAFGKPAHQQVSGLSLDSVLEEAAGEKSPSVKSPKSPKSPKASPRVTLHSPRQEERDKENKEKQVVASLWDSVNPTGTRAAGPSEHPRNAVSKLGGRGKDDPRIDAMRRSRIAALESRGSVLQSAQRVFGEADAKLADKLSKATKAKALSAPIVPRLLLPPEPGRAISPPTRMDKYIDDSLKRQNLLQSANKVAHTVTAMQDGLRVLPVSDFPQPAALVAPCQWLTTLNFYEQLAALTPMFAPASAADASNNHARAALTKNRWRRGHMHVDTGEEVKTPDAEDKDGAVRSVSYSGKSIQKEQWLDEDGNEIPNTSDTAGTIDADSEKMAESGSASFALPVIEVNSSCRAYQTVRRAFQSCDVNCLYFGDDDEKAPAAEPATTVVSEIFFSDLTAVMDSLKIRSRVVFSADMGNELEDVFVSDSRCSNPTPVQMSLEGWRTSKDLQTGLIAGTGTALWTCLPVWWKQQWTSYLQTRLDLKIEIEKKVKKFRNVASRRKLKENETKNFLAITDIVQKLNTEIEMFGNSEVGLASADTESKEQAVRRLSWDVFLRFLKWVVEYGVSNAKQIRHLIAKEIWKNSRNTAVSNAAKYIIAKRIEKDARNKILAMAPKKKVEKKDKDFRVQKSLFVGYFPKTEADVKAEVEATIAEEKEKDRQLEQELHAKHLAEAEAHEAQAKHAKELQNADDKRSTSEQEALASDAADDLKVALEHLATEKLEAGETASVEAAVLTEADLEQLKSSGKADGVDLAAMFAEADEEVAEEEKAHGSRSRKEPRAAAPAVAAAASDVPVAAAAATAALAATATEVEVPTSARGRFKAAQAEKDKKDKEEKAAALTPATPIAPKEKLSARERFKVAQAEKDKKDKEDEEAAVAEMLAMAADARQGRVSTPEKEDAHAIVPTLLSARQRFKSAQVNKTTEKDTEEVEEVLD